MPNATQQTIIQLERDFPAYEVWVSPRPSDGPLWHARRWDGTRAVLNASSASALEHHIETDVEELT